MVQLSPAAQLITKKFAYFRFPQFPWASDAIAWAAFALPMQMYARDLLPVHDGVQFNIPALSGDYNYESCEISFKTKFFILFPAGGGTAPASYQSPFDVSAYGGTGTYDGLPLANGFQAPKDSFFCDKINLNTIQIPKLFVDGGSDLGSLANTLTTIVNPNPAAAVWQIRAEMFCEVKLRG